MIATGVRWVCGWGRPRSQEFQGQNPTSHQNQDRKVVNLKDTLGSAELLQKSLQVAVLLFWWRRRARFQSPSWKDFETGKC